MARGRSQFFNEYVGDLTGSGTYDSACLSETDTVQRMRIQNMDEQFFDCETPKLGQLSSTTNQCSAEEITMKDSITQLIY